MKLFSKKKNGVKQLIFRCKNYKGCMETAHKLDMDNMENYWRTRYIICRIILKEDFGVNVDEL